MMLRNRQRVSITLPIATIFLAIAIIWPKLIHSSAHLGHNGDDILRGSVFGLAIGMLLMTGIHMRRERRSGQDRKVAKKDSSQ
jgi:phosphotransferase system  glucose/maltose/N-acetylglucosamine-specific IIC component